MPTVKRYPKRQLVVSADGSVEDRQGNTILFSVNRFKKQIVEGDNCFLCGRARTQTQFNDEHIIPDWLLSELGLHGKKITLPNGGTIPYGRFKLPCCVRCNSLLGEKIEAPMSALIKSGYGGLTKHLKRKGLRIVFLWLALVFLKTHLKDKSLRFHRDLREATTKIGELYDWESMHHIHCVVRTVLTGARLDSSVVGSIFVLMAKQRSHFDQFDYADNYRAKSIMIRFKEIVFFTSLNDSCATYSLLKNSKISEIAGPLSPIQIREVFARVTCTRLLITVPSHRIRTR